MCQLDWAMGCPDIWSNVFLDMSVKMFLDEINIWIGRLSKPDFALLKVGGFHPIRWRSEYNKENKKAEGEGTGLCLTAWVWILFFFLPCLQTWTEALISAQPAFRLEPHHQFSGTLACQLQILRLNSFHNCMSHFLIILINICVYINRNEYLYTSRYKNLFIYW